MKTVEVIEKTNAGKSLFYPHNELAKTFAELSRRKGFTAQDVELIKQLGFKVKAVSESREL